MEALVVGHGSPHPARYVADYPDPIPAAGEVAIRVHLAGICATDLEIMRGYLRFEGVPGHEFVGTVVAGPPRLYGQRVVAEINCACGRCDLCRAGLPGHCRRRTVLGIAGRDGAFAEMLAVPERNCHAVPAEVDDAAAVFVEPLAAALHVLQVEPISDAARAAVLGSGRLGLLVAQMLARHGCRPQVLGRNPHTLALCRRWGMATMELAGFVPAADYDLVVECTGSPDGLRLALQMCRPRGTIILKSTYADRPALDLAPVVVHELRIFGSRCGPFAEALRLLRERKIEVAELVSGIYPLRRGAEALAAAADPRNIKILLRPGIA